MLSYRHGFHAGNHADVLKHAVWLFCARYLQRKPGGVLFLDTHAGAGSYDLRSAEAEKTGEYREGIARVLAQASGEAPALVADYAALVRALGPAGNGLHIYPGSPAFAAAVARPQDRIMLCELHPTDFARLQGWAKGRGRIAVRRADGLAALRRELPPPERRALVLIDPSYEVKTEYDAVADSLIAAWRKFPGGVYVLWYPVIERARAETLAERLRAGGLRKAFRIELCVAADMPGRGMTGSGLIAVNPPYLLPAAAADALGWLAKTLDAKGPFTADWLVPEYQNGHS